MGLNLQYLPENSHVCLCILLKEICYAYIRLNEFNS